MAHITLYGVLFKNKYKLDFIVATFRLHIAGDKDGPKLLQIVSVATGQRIEMFLDDYYFMELRTRPSCDLPYERELYLSAENRFHVQAELFSLKEGPRFMYVEAMENPISSIARFLLHNLKA